MNGQIVIERVQYFFYTTWAGQLFRYAIHFGPDYPDFQHVEPEEGAAEIGYGVSRNVIWQQGEPRGWFYTTDHASSAGEEGVES